MTQLQGTRSYELRQFGITLSYLAKLADRSVGYVKLWSSGNAHSPHLDAVAAKLLEIRKAELSNAQGL